MRVPKPNWAGKTKRPQETVGPKPTPNGRVVATKPDLTVTFKVGEPPGVREWRKRMALRPEDV